MTDERKTNKRRENRGPKPQSANRTRASADAPGKPDDPKWKDHRPRGRVR